MKGRISLVLLAAIAAALLAVSGALASGGSGSGGGGGGGSTTPPVANPLPTTPPAPDVVLRESFGPGVDPSFVRPQGGNGNLRQVSAGTGLSGFWAEYPGSKNEQWTTAADGWHFAFASLNPFETLASPVQPLPFNGIAFSDWHSGIAAYPDALVPFRGASSRYSVSAEMYPAPIAGAYDALGLTTSGATLANLAAGGQISVQLSQVQPSDGVSGWFQVLAGAQVLASGPVLLSGFTPVAITVDPAAQTIGVAVDGAVVGSWPARVTPSFIALEGQGWADDLVVRTLP